MAKTNDGGMSYDKTLQNAIDKASVPQYLSTKGEIVSYYQDKYPGRGAAGWKQHLVQDLAAITGLKPKNLERRFDPSRLNKPAGKAAKDYAQLGQQIGPIGKKPPGKGYQIYWVLGLHISKSRNEVRSQTQTVFGPDAYAFANGQASFKPLLDQYFNGANNNPVQNVTHVYELKITPL